ncbi:MAG TPA: GNAT family N-acetyltransferase [Acidimicrobiia bacterium]|nr:GNAT family N-acetyltransferase [Acidimicrobiia bacterium]
MWEIRTITSDDADLFRSRISRGFGGDATDDEDARERFEATFEYERTFGVFDGKDIVGTGGAFSLGVTVPGGEVVPMGGTTVITVQPTHRRRGILRALMGRHLDEVAERGESLAGLWASESSIYGRFGYGQATYRHKSDLDAGKVTFRDNDLKGNVRLLERDEAESIIPRLYEDALTTRAGMLTRSEAWWKYRVLADVESWRDGRSALRHAVYEADGEAKGYALYRQKSKWDDFLADGEVDVVEIIAPDADAYRGIWSFLTRIDLFPRVSWWNAPVDDPLSLMITDPRRVRRSVADALWIRIMDVAGALTRRTYERDGVVTLEVTDAFRAGTTGVYRLEVSNGESNCVAVDATPDIALDLDVLGHLYLGGGDAMAMARAGRIGGDTNAIQRLNGMFRTIPAPWCPEVF